jgi:hypothetical protein
MYKATQKLLSKWNFNRPCGIGASPQSSTKEGPPPRDPTRLMRNCAPGLLVVTRAASLHDNKMLFCSLAYDAPMVRVLPLHRQMEGHLLRRSFGDLARAAASAATRNQLVRSSTGKELPLVGLPANRFEGQRLSTAVHLSWERTLAPFALQ